MKISSRLILILHLPLFHFLLLMMCLVLLLILSQVLCIRDVTNCLILLLNHYLIILCTRLASTRVSRSLDWYGFSSFALQTTLDNTFVPKSYSYTSTQSVSVKLCRMNFRLFKTSHFTLLELSSLGVNRYTSSRYVMMALSSNIKLV